MNNVFSPREIVELAIKIEENGKNFYSRMGEKVDNDEVKKLLLFLAEEEERHRAFFSTLLDEVSVPIVESYSGEFQAYMNALAKECVFTQELVEEYLNKEFKGVYDLLSFALKIEKDSIILYQEMEQYLLKDKDKVKKIIDEERKHFVMIWEMRAKLDK